MAIMAERITFESEPGITVPGLFVMPEEWHKAAPFVVYVGEWGKGQGLADGTVEQLVAGGFGVLAIDVRGVGETATTDFEAATNALMMDRPLFGQRVWDVLRAVDFLWERCYIAPQIDKGRLVVAGEGAGGLLALYACALDERLAGGVALNIPLSYTALLRHGARFPASVYLFDVLRHFDVADLASACAPRPLWLKGVDGWRRPVAPADMDDLLRTTREAYAMAGAARTHLELQPDGTTKELAGWLSAALA